jgi:hypothetical protein
MPILLVLFHRKQIMNELKIEYFLKIRKQSKKIILCVKIATEKSRTL